MSLSRLGSLPGLLRRRLEGRRALQAALHNSAWLAGDRALRMLLGVLVGAWVARYLGPAQFGELAYAIALIAVFQSVAKLGLDGIVIRDIARDASTAPAVLGSALLLRLFAGALCLAAVVLVVVAIRPGDARAASLVALIGIGLVLQAGDTFDLWFQSQNQSRFTVSAKACAYLTTNAARVVGILLEAPLEAFAAITVIDAGLSAGFLAAVYRRWPAASKWNWSMGTAAGLVRESWPLMLSGLAVMLYMRIDQIMLRELAGEAELGVFSVILPLSEGWSFIPLIAVTSALPHLSRLRQHDEALYKERLQLLFRVLAWLAVAIAVTVACLSHPLVRLLYGASFTRAGDVLAIHVFSVIPVFLGMAQTVWIWNESKAKLLLYNSLLGAACNIALNLWLIPRFGATGAAVSTVVSYCVAVMLSNLLFCPEVFRMQLRAFMLWDKTRA